MGEYSLFDSGSSFDNGYQPDTTSFYDSSSLGSPYADLYSGYNLGDDKSWYGDLWNWAKTDTSASTIAGALGGAYNAYTQHQAADDKKDQFNLTREDNLKFQQEKMDLLREQMAMEGENAAAQIALQQAILDDKVKTRRAHNDSIAKPSTAAKKFNFG